MEGPVGLPVRLFATDRYPVGRVNVYSRPDLLGFVRAHLHDTDSWEDILGSSFGQLFKISVTRCYISCKLLHSLLTRQLVTKRRYELWTLFGSQPLRFSLAEFEGVTGLNCSEFPRSYLPDSDPDTLTGEGSPWDTFIGPNKHARISDLMDLIRYSEGMDRWRRTGLALFLIVEGVIVASHQGNNRLTPKYVDMLGDREGFMNFPWGRESFLKTIASMIPSRMSVIGNDSCENVMVKLLKQVSMSLKGFPLALQLLAFKAIPELEENIPNYYDIRTSLEVDFEAHAKNAALTLNSFLVVENNPEVFIFTPIHRYGEEGRRPMWNDEAEDESVALLEELILKGNVFEYKDWKGGDISEGMIKRPVVSVSMGRVQDEPLVGKGGNVQKLPSRRRAYLKRSCKTSGGIETDDVSDVMCGVKESDVGECVKNSGKSKGCVNRWDKLSRTTNDKYPGSCGSSSETKDIRGFPPMPGQGTLVLRIGWSGV